MASLSTRVVVSICRVVFGGKLGVFQVFFFVCVVVFCALPGAPSG